MTREEAIRKLQKQKAEYLEEWVDYNGVAEAYDVAIEVLSAEAVQPEPLTDKEQIIFLAAMSREERVCKQVDVEYGDCREAYEDSLVSICHEITRKVKGALWT